MSVRWKCFETPSASLNATRYRVAMRILSSVLLLIPLGAFGTPSWAAEPAAAVTVYSFEVGATFTTDEATLGARRMQWSGSLERSLARVFRDGSVGWRIHLPEVLLRQNEESSRSALTGKAFELRRFPMGEVLRLSGFEHLVGEGRDGELLAPLWWGLSPLPPALKRGRSAMRGSTFPLLVNEAAGIRFQSTLEWTHLGRERVPDLDRKRLIRLGYEGTVRPTGREASFLLPIELSGTVSGQLWLRPHTLEVIRHQVDWTLTYTAPPDGSFEWQTHRQALSLSMERSHERARSESEVRVSIPDSHELALYLDPGSVRAILHENSARWAPCFEGGESSPDPVAVRMTVDSGGEIRSISGLDANTSPRLIECLRTCADGLLLPTHHEEIESFRYVLVWRDEQIQPYPVVEFERRDMGTLFLRASVGEPRLVE